ncbi:MAG: CRISPR system precrRNA processing endoribonuclease RAMP protein Cas6 [Deltaproteobacteria bacterium]|nr:CRISPR system precrRNA processing endoribonuclease RAMP protein Cas6 [Deltaproteobacteria bacterium]
MLDNFYFSKFSLSLKAKDPIVMPPYKGSTFRGGFGHAFKKIVCTVKRQTCDNCLLKSKCIYCYIFETPPPEGSKALRNYKSIQHPFVIEPPLEKKTTYLPGETLLFNLLLIGRATEYLPYFIYTFDELGKLGIGKGRGKYELLEVKHLMTDGRYEPIYSSNDRTLKGSCNILTASDIMRAKKENIKTLRLNFLTPLRIISDGDLVVDFKFHHLIRSLLRRVSTLSYFHCGKRLELDFKGLIERAEKIETVSSELKWYDWERYSARQDVRMKMGGLIGKIDFKGNMEEFMPLIRLGEFIHAGKGTSFGLGKYEIE